MPGFAETVHPAASVEVRLGRGNAGRKQNPKLGRDDGGTRRRTVFADLALAGMEVDGLGRMVAAAGYARSKPKSANLTSRRGLRKVSVSLCASGEIADGMHFGGTKAAATNLKLQPSGISAGENARRCVPGVVTIDPAERRRKAMSGQLR